MTDNEAQMNAVWASVRYLLVTVGGVMVTAGLGQSGIYETVMLLAGSITVLGPAGWGVYVAIKHALDKRSVQAQAVQAGINLTVSGKALAADGKTVVLQNDGSIPPLPVTPQTAAEIVKDFGPK